MAKYHTVKFHMGVVPMQDFWLELDGKPIENVVRISVEGVVKGLSKVQIELLANVDADVEVHEAELEVKDA